MKKTKTIRHKKTSKKKVTFSSMMSRGSITFKLLIAIVILGSIALVNGFFPKNQITPVNPDGPKYKPVTGDSTQQKDSLQLKTIKFEACSQTIAVEMVLDRSGSMRSPITKMNDLKTASLFFINKLTDDAPIGIVSYDSSVREDLSIQAYGPVKSQVTTIINGLQPGTNTHTRDALLRAKQALEVALPKFPGRQFSLILVSDGVPNDPVLQDPRRDPNVGDQIKNMGVKIFAIAITQGLQPAQQQTMKDVMGNVASPNSFFEAPDTSQLENIYNKIGFEICNVAG